jgi:hypothetical protein
MTKNLPKLGQGPTFHDLVHLLLFYGEIDRGGHGCVLSLKFCLHMVTRIQHRQTVMKSSMDLN